MLVQGVTGESLYRGMARAIRDWKQQPGRDIYMLSNKATWTEIKRQNPITLKGSGSTLLADTAR